MPPHLGCLPPSIHQPPRRLKAHCVTLGLDKRGLWRQRGGDGDVRETAEWTDAEPLSDSKCGVHSAVSDSTTVAKTPSKSSTSDFRQKIGNKRKKSILVRLSSTG